ncbi:adenine DNA glycosylase isoform X3 [Brachypodium distachyon]|nr:adenine DNA glycosylase isoform X3 [Brachypodium distachyon]XP_014757627.1 adenine DNA glycosylase isoform X3 [Brachypodium distachyon]XP_024310242.1 adenine DNA glycosylase isoform X3 [Brachypodium distachyon]XP_024310243.1 adenine DNA glycosylase isoform X3 [Brachypodium distachyon]XP_024310244.1 adenine DNA glycosylase isoform X3 [Brachypodium distachyon]XP_024310245.1 adenine DNA glycosylase isoform X3 [Brachypodium distachyon]XP_024310246.1 adenine DNA glycosylase isoform X3 [Brachypo|eukprot:XP_014757626.1 adenine DNA glycosylase isoform X3 [Brachypodium distachyon]
MAKSPKAAAATTRRPTRKPRAASASAASAPPSADIEDLAVPASAAAAVRAGLLPWYDAHRRDLPWRFSAAPGREGKEERAYAVWVSEVMLQQTRVPVVVDYYSRWMARWPTVETLAAATQEEVNEMWAGLGYYRRARFLLEGAKQIAEKGEFPSTASTLRQVRGIGDYTAGAIASIAFNEVTPLVDGNVVRVLSRLFAIADNPKESSTVKRFWELAGQLVDPSRPGDFNQAMMELGATLCSKTKPGCSQCPVSSHCQALELSRENPSVGVTDYPRVVPKSKPRCDFAAVCVVEIAQCLEPDMADRRGKDNLFLMVKRPEQGLLAGLWEFPSVLVDESKTDLVNRRKEMDTYLKQLLGIDLKRTSDVILREDVGQHVHIFSHIRLTMNVELVILTVKVVDDVGRLCEKGQDNAELKLVDESSIDSMGLTSGIRKVYNMVKAFKMKKLPEQSPMPTRKRSRRQKQ